MNQQNTDISITFGCWCSLGLAADYFLSQVFTSLYNTDDSCFVCAPTGSGKTICAEFALLRLLAREQQARAGGEGGGTSLKDGKPLVHAVYVAPLEPLVTERYGDWQEKLVKGLGIKMARLTGGFWLVLEFAWVVGFLGAAGGCKACCCFVLTLLCVAAVPSLGSIVRLLWCVLDQIVN
jgi:hypothetical protein